MKKYLLCAAVFIIILYGFYVFIPLSEPPVSSVRIIAHRGDSAHAPENSIPAILSAMRNGTDCVEIDIRCSSDGIPIAFHDATLKRLTGKKRTVSDLTYHEVSLYPLIFAEGYSSYPQTTVCSLEEILRLVSDQPELCLHLELKTADLEEKVVSLLQKYDSVCSYEISSANSDILQTLHQIDPTLKTTLVLTCAGDVVRYCTQPPEMIDGISVKSCFVLPPLVYLAHKRGHKIYAWTVNKAPAARRLSRLNIDGIITDDPAMLRKTLS